MLIDGKSPAAGRNPGGFGSGFGATSCRRVFRSGYAGTYASARQSPIALGTSPTNNDRKPAAIPLPSELVLYKIR